MSTWASIELDGMHILSTQNYIHQWYFRKSDRFKTLPEEDDPESSPQYGYKAASKTIARRLAFDGYDLDSLKQDFLKQLAIMIVDCEAMTKIDPHGKCAQLLPVLRNSTFDDWLSRLKRIKDEGLEISFSPGKSVDYGDALLNFMLFTSYTETYFFTDQPSAGDFHFPCTSEEMWAVALLQIVPDDSYFILDATQMISAGWTDDFEDFIEYHQDHTAFYSTFKASLTETLELSKLSRDNAALARLLFANIITLLETYLSDTLRKQVFKRGAVLRRFVKSHDVFKNSKKEPVSEIFDIYDKVPELVNNAIDNISFHNIVTAKKLYKEVLATSFPDDINELLKAVETRHDIIHRNGKDVKNNVIKVNMVEVEALAQLVENTVQFIDQQVKDGLLDDDGED